MQKCRYWLLMLVAVSGTASARTERPAIIRTHWILPDESQPRGSSSLQSVMIAAHNSVRASAHVPPVRWDPELAAEANAYARQLARSGLFQHSSANRGSKPQGENLWMGTRGAFSYQEMVSSWAEERRHYRHRAAPDFSNTGNWGDVGHYTQMVWRSTTAIGCAVAANHNNEYLVCRYNPPGNVYGQLAFGG